MQINLSLYLGLSDGTRPPRAARLPVLASFLHRLGFASSTYTALIKRGLVSFSANPELAYKPTDAGMFLYAQHQTDLYLETEGE